MDAYYEKRKEFAIIWSTKMEINPEKVKKSFEEDLQEHAKVIKSDEFKKARSLVRKETTRFHQILCALRCMGLKEYKIGDTCILDHGGFILFRTKGKEDALCFDRPEPFTGGD